MLIQSRFVSHHLRIETKHNFEKIIKIVDKNATHFVTNWALFFLPEFFLSVVGVDVPFQIPFRAGFL